MKCDAKSMLELDFWRASGIKVFLLLLYWERGWKYEMRHSHLLKRLSLIFFSSKYFDNPLLRKIYFGFHVSKTLSHFIFRLLSSSSSPPLLPLKSQRAMVKIFIGIFGGGERKFSFKFHYKLSFSPLCFSLSRER
jgi:hypothetical protein